MVEMPRVSCFLITFATLLFTIRESLLSFGLSCFICILPGLVFWPFLICSWQNISWCLVMRLWVSTRSSSIGHQNLWTGTFQINWGFILGQRVMLSTYLWSDLALSICRWEMCGQVKVVVKIENEEDLLVLQVSMSVWHKSLWLHLNRIFYELNRLSCHLAECFVAKENIHAPYPLPVWLAFICDCLHFLLLSKSKGTSIWAHFSNLVVVDFGPPLQVCVSFLKIIPHFSLCFLGLLVTSSLILFCLFAMWTTFGQRLWKFVSNITENFPVALHLSLLINHRLFWDEALLKKSWPTCLCTCLRISLVGRNVCLHVFGLYGSASLVTNEPIIHLYVFRGSSYASQDQGIWSLSLELMHSRIPCLVSKSPFEHVPKP